MNDKRLLNILKSQSLIYVSFRIGSLYDRSFEGVTNFISDLYDDDDTYRSYVNSITELLFEISETKSPK